MSDSDNEQSTISLNDLALYKFFLVRLQNLNKIFNQSLIWKVFISTINAEKDWRKEPETGRKDCSRQASVTKLSVSNLLNFLWNPSYQVIFNRLYEAFFPTDNILNENIYDARIRPASMNSSDGPTNIQVNLMLRSIDKIDDVKMEFSTQITFRCVFSTARLYGIVLFVFLLFRQQWYDDRLRFGNKISPHMKGFKSHIIKASAERPFNN